MTLETIAPTSRRAVIAGTLGALAASVAAALGRPTPVSAADVVLGATNNTSATTRIVTTSEFGVALDGVATALTGEAIGIRGEVFSAHNGNGTGVYGTGPWHGVIGHTGPGGTGVEGRGRIGVFGRGEVSGSSRGVLGYTESPAGVGVLGQATSSTGDVSTGYPNGVRGEAFDAGFGVYGRGKYGGVYGRSVSNPGVTGESAGLGVFGKSTGSSGSGVFGRNDAVSGSTYGTRGRAASTTGRGVFGEGFATTGANYGVYGQSWSTSGTGVRGYANAATGNTYGVNGRVDSPTGVAVNGHAVVATGSAIGVLGRSDSVDGRGGYFITSGAKIGTALHTVGRVRFQNCVGLDKVSAGESSVIVTPGIDILATSACVATLQGDAGPGVTVKHVTMNPAGDTFTITLSGAAVSAVLVAWHVFG